MHSTGKWNNNVSYYLVATYNRAGVFWPTSVNSYNAWGNVSNYVEHETFTDEAAIPTDKYENRLVNKAVKYIIKVR